MYGVAIVLSFFLLWMITSRFMPDDRGATSIEYAIIAIGVFLVIVAGAALIGNALTVPFGAVASHL